MSSKKSLSEEELNKLIEILSQRKSDNEGRVSLEEVRASLSQLGLSDFWEESDIEKVKKQVSKEMKKRQFQSYLFFGLVLTAIIAPLSAYGGFRVKEVLAAKFPEMFGISNSDSAKLAAEIESLKSEKKTLEDKIEELEKEKGTSDRSDSSPSAPPSSLTPPPTNSSPSSPQPSSKSYEAHGVTFELQTCKTSDTTPRSQSISCVFLITSQKDAAKVSLFAGNHRARSRMFEGGKEYISSGVSIGTDSNQYAVSNTLIKETPMEAVITFDNVLLDVKKIETLSVLSYLESSDSNNDVSMTFRNLPLSK
jgi:cell division protein FtsB